jgi:hypothetical protein
MLLNKKRYRLVSKVIDTWRDEHVITQEKSQKLRNSLEISKFDWKRLSKYSFWIAGISVAIAVFATILDDAIMELLKHIVRIPDIAKSILLALIASGFFFWGFKKKKTNPTKIFSNEFLLFIGAIISGVSIFFMGKSVDTAKDHFSILLLMGSIVYLAIGALFPSAPMWVLGLLTLGSWFGTETGYVSGWGAYFLGMNYPLRFVVLGAVIIAISFFMQRTRFSRLTKSTYIIGLLNLFLALWMMSIWGNYGSMLSWHAASVAERFLWSILFAVAALGAIIWGLKNDDSVARGFGITFLFINLYTKYFEYFWKVSHKAIFFAILGISFWIVGKYSERAFNALKGKLIEIPEDGS